MGLPSKITMTSKIVTAAVIVLVMFAQALQTRHDAASPDPSAPKEKRTFGIHGVVGRLYPGRHAVLVLHVQNYQPFAITLHRISVRVHRPSPRCAAGNVRIRPFEGRRRIGARRSVHLRLRVRMRKTAPNGCQGILFPLTYDGKAVRA
jgi:hypothetical protein